MREGEMVKVGDRVIKLRYESRRWVWMDEYDQDGKLVSSRLVRVEEAKR